MPLTTTIQVKLDSQLFREFAIFDTFYRKQRWKAPVLFASILLVSAILCLSRYRVAEQAALLVIILVAIGLGLPAVYFINFLLSINAQANKMNLKTPQQVYSLTLTDAPEGIHVTSPTGQAADYLWKNIHGVYERKKCVYLYVNSDKAFILPYRDIKDEKTFHTIIRVKQSL